MVRALSIDELGLGLECLAAHAVQARIHTLVDVTVVVDPLKEVTHELLVARVRGANVEVRLGANCGWQRAPHLADAVDVLLRLEPLLLGDAKHLRPCSSTPVRKNASSPRCR